MQIKESVAKNIRLVKMAIEMVIDCIDKNIPEDDVLYIRLSNEVLNKIFKKYNATTVEQTMVKQMFGTIQHLYLDNRKQSMNTTTMGGVGRQPANKVSTVFINIAGLFGDYSEKTKDELLSFKGNKSITNFKALLGHEIRHVFQNMDYADKLPDPNREDYDYNADPLEIDASFIESLLDNDIAHFTDINEFVTKVIESFRSKKEFGTKVEKHYKRQAAKFFTMYHQKDSAAITLYDKLSTFKNTLYNEITTDIVSGIEKINSDVINKVKADHIKYGSMDNFPEGLQDDYVSISNKSAAICSIIKTFIYNDDDADKISEPSIHLTLATIIYVNKHHKIRNIVRIVNKILYRSNLTLKDTQSYLKTAGFFRNHKNTPVIIKAIDDYIAKM